MEWNENVPFWEWVGDGRLCNDCSLYQSCSFCMESRWTVNDSSLLLNSNLLTSDCNRLSSWFFCSSCALRPSTMLPNVVILSRRWGTSLAALLTYLYIDHHHGWIILHFNRCFCFLSSRSSYLCEFVAQCTSFFTAEIADGLQRRRLLL